MRDLHKLRNRTEFSLDNRQIALIFAGLLAVCVVMFALGVMVGRGMGEYTVRPEAVAAAPPPPDPAAQLVGISGQAAGQGGVPVEEAPLDAAKQAEQAAVSESPEAAERERVAEVVSNLRAGVAPPPPGATPPAAPAAAAAPAAPAKAAATPPVVAPVAPAKKAAAPPAPAASEDAALAEARAKVAARSGASGGGKYTIQVGSFQTAAEARSMTDRLTRKGYAAYIVSAEIPGMGTWHRVRIGHFASRNDAKSYASEFKAREGIEPFVAINPR